MRLAVAHAVLYALCFSSSIENSFAAEVNSSWVTLGQAKIQKKIRPTVTFNPELSLQQNNELLNKHRSQTIIVSSTIPVSQLRSLKLVNKPVQLQIDSSTFNGRVTAISLSSDQSQATVFAEISDGQLSSANLSDKEAGLLKIEG
ncbi:MAG: hypothetical protein U0930_18040 [Pirellulales bacterium]